MLEQENISRIRILLKAHPRGLTITEVSQNLKMNRNSAAKYLEILQISGLVESKSYGTARVFFLSHRLPISALVSITADPVITLNENNHILFVNDSFCTFFAVQKEEVAEKHIVEIFKSGIGSEILPGIFSDIIAGKEEVREVHLSRDTGDFFFKIKSMQTVFDDGSRGITIIMEDVTREKKARIELAAKEARYRGIVEDQTDFVIRFLPSGILSFSNTSFCQFLNKRPDALLGTPFSDTLHQKDRGVFDRCRSSLTRENPVATFECRSALPAGKVRWIFWTLRVMYDCGRDPVEYQAVGHDITERKEDAERVDRQLSQMEFFSARLQQFIELPPGEDIYRVIGTGLSDILPVAAICVSSYDPQTSTLTIQAVCNENDKDFFTDSIGRDIVGVKIPLGDQQLVSELLRGKLFGRTGNLYEVICHQVPEATCAAIEDALNLGDYYSVGLTWRGALLGAATFSARKGGVMENTPLVETYVRAASIALQHYLAERALARSEKLYRSVIENIQDVFYRSDREGNLIMGSPSWARLLGYDSMAECLGKNIAETFYIHPEKRKEFLEAVMTQGSVTAYDVVLKKKDGSPVHVSTSSHSYYDEYGRVLGVEGVFRDMTESREAEKKIQQYIADMEFISQKLLEFISMDPSENIYQKIADDFATLIPGSVIAVNSYDPKSGIVTVQGSVMSDRQRETCRRILGQEPAGSMFLIDETGLALIRTGRLLHPGLPLFDMLFKSVPETVAHKLETELGLEDNYAIGFVRGSEVLGNAVALMPHGVTIPNLPLVEMYARGASISLQRHLADEARCRSDETFLNITRYSPFPIAIIGPDETFQYINESFTRLFGYTLKDFRTVEEWLHLALPDLVYREDILKVWKSEQENYHPGYTFTRTYKIHCKDLTVKEIVVRVLVLFGENVCVIYEDITERTRAEQTDRLLSSIIQSTADAIIGKDPGGTVISWNRAAERLYGYTAEEMTGQHISRIIPPERRAEMEDIFRQIGGGTSFGPLDTQRVRKDGRVIDVSVTISPIRDNAGTIIGASTIARDISAEKAETRLRESEEQYRSLVENISVGLYRSTGDPAGHFVWGNSSLVKILGYSSFDQLKGVDIATIFREQDGRKKLLDDLKREGFVKNREIALKRPDGETVSVLVTALARFDTGGGLSCINGIVEDISSQRRAEERVKVMVREVQEIAALIPNPILVVDQNNVVVAWNAAMEQMTGVLTSQVMGKTGIDHLLPYHDASRPPLFSLLDAPAAVLEGYYPGAFRDGASIVAQVEKRTPHSGPSGSFMVRASPLSGPDGTRQGALEIIHNAPDKDGPFMASFPP